MRDEVPVAVPGGTLYPCPDRDKYSRSDPTAWIHAGENGGVSIGLAHGSVEGVQQGEPDYPIPRDAAQRAGLDYLALGHWHSTATYPGEDGAVRMAYAGTHEATGFGERDSGNVLVVDISAAGAAPDVTPVGTGGLCWKQMERDIRHGGDLERLRQEIEALESPSSTLLDLRITGLLSADEQGEIARIGEILNSRLLFSRVDVSELVPSPGDDGWVADLPPGVVRQAGLRLKELTDTGFSGERPEGAFPVWLRVRCWSYMLWFMRCRGDTALADRFGLALFCNFAGGRALR